MQVGTAEEAVLQPLSRKWRKIQFFFSIKKLGLMIKIYDKIKEDSISYNFAEHSFMLQSQFTRYVQEIFC